MKFSELPVEDRKHISQKVLNLGKSVSVSFMVIGAVFIAKLSSHYQGISGFLVAFLGILIVVILGAVIAYNIGNKMSKNFAVLK